MRMQFTISAALSIGCGGVKSLTDAQISPGDGLGDALALMCNPTEKFSAPMPIPGLEMIDGGSVHLSTDELTLYFSSSSADLYVARRNAIADAFDMPTKLAVQSSSSGDNDPMVSPDGLTLWFASNRVANEGFHLYVATRASTLAEFSAPGLAAAVNATDTQQSDLQLFVTRDEKELWFTSTRAGGLGGYDIWRSPLTANGFATPVKVPKLSSSADDWFPTLSVDALTVYFTSNRAVAGTKGSFDIWRSHRSVISDGLPAPTLVPELNTMGTDYATWLSADNCRMYGFSDGSGSPRMYFAIRQP